jgi:AcrR family transcriptional regulator
MKRDSSELRTRIVDTALRLLREEGMKSLSQPSVTRAAGVQHGHFTYYFPKKIDLLQAVVRRYAELVGKDLEVAITRSATRHRTDSETRHQAKRLVRRLVKDVTRTRMLLGLLVEADQEPELRDVLIDSARGSRSVVAWLIGRAPEDADVDIVLALMWGLEIQQFLFQSRRSEIATDQLMERVFDWLMQEPPKRRRRIATAT